MERSLSLLRSRAFEIALGLLILLTAPLGVRSRSLWVGDETRDAAIATEMYRAHDFLHPSLAGRPVPEKPFLFYATVASVYRLAGVNPVSTRLPSVVFSALTLLAAGLAGKLLFGPRAGLLAAAILSTTYLFVLNAHDCVVDVALAAFVGLGFAAFVAASRREGPSWTAGFGAAAGAAMLVKGFVGPALLAALTIPFWWLAVPRPRLSRAIRPAAVLIPIAALGVWIGTVWSRGRWPAISEYFWHHQFGRFLGFRHEEFSHHDAPAYFYLAALPGILFPWSLLLPMALFRRRASQTRERRALTLALVAAFVFLSLAGTKRTIYFLPLTPIAAILLGAELEERLRQPAREGRHLLLLVQTLVVAGGAAAVALLPALADHHLSAQEIAVIAAVGLLSGCMFVAAGRSARKLVAASLLLAVGSLVLLDRYSVPRLDRRERRASEFLDRVNRRLSPGDRLYTFELNEDVLGLAYLKLKVPPRPLDDPARFSSQAAERGGFALLEKWKLARLPPAARRELKPLEVGYCGGRVVLFCEGRQTLARLPGRTRRPG